MAGSIKKDSYTQNTSSDKKSILIDVTDFNLKNRANEAASSSNRNSTGFDNTFFSEKKIPDKSSNTTTKTSSSTATTPDLTVSHPPSRATQKILLRLSSHSQDPTNAFYALSFARKLASAPNVQVIVFFDKESVNALNVHNMQAHIMKGSPQAKTMKMEIESYMANGGRIIASNFWAERLGFNSGNSSAGIEFLDDEKVAAEIIEADKLLEY